MTTANWDTRPDGNLATHQILGWDIASAGLLGMLRLRYAGSEQEFEKGGQTLQIHLTPDQLRDMSQDLFQLAFRIEAQAKTRQ